MATVSQNFVPTFPIPQDGNDSFNRYDLITALADLDNHTHAANSGPPVKRLYYGAASGTAGGIAAGHAGSVFIETSTPFKFWYDDGTIWRELVDSAIAQTLSNKTLTAPRLTSPTSDGLVIDNNHALSFKDSGAAIRSAMLLTTTNDVRLYAAKSGGHVSVFDYTGLVEVLTIDGDTGNVTATGFVKANGYRALLQPTAADVMAQYGVGTSSNGAAVTVTFTTAFSGGTPGVTATATGAFVANGYSVLIESISNTAFTFSCINAANARANSIPISWIALGLR